MDAKWTGAGTYLVLCAAAIVALSVVVPGEASQDSSGAGGPVISDSELEERADGLAYRIGTDEPFTGTVISKFLNGQPMSETNYRNGKLHGRSITWYESGRMRMDSSYKDGERDGVWTKWDKDGHVQFQRQYQDGARRF